MQVNFATYIHVLCNNSVSSMKQYCNVFKIAIKIDHIILYFLFSFLKSNSKSIPEHLRHGFATQNFLHSQQPLWKSELTFGMWIKELHRMAFEIAMHKRTPSKHHETPSQI